MVLTLKEDKNKKEKWSFGLESWHKPQYTCPITVNLIQICNIRPSVSVTSYRKQTSFQRKLLQT